MSFTFTRRPESKRATRQAGLALAILALHGALAYLLLSPDLWRDWSMKTAPEEITWLVLAAPQIEQPKTVVREPVALPRVQPTPLTRPSASPRTQPLASLPDIPPQDSGLAALRSYVWCGALDGGKQWSGQQKNCDKVKWGLQTAALSKRAPTERERELTRQFERDLAFDKAPKRIPCVNGMIDIICVVQGALNGFEYKMASYGDINPAKTACASRFDGEACARIYSLNSTSPTAVHR